MSNAAAMTINATATATREIAYVAARKLSPKHPMPMPGGGSKTKNPARARGAGPHGVTGVRSGMKPKRGQQVSSAGRIGQQQFGLWTEAKSPANKKSRATLPGITRLGAPQDRAS